MSKGREKQSDLESQGKRRLIEVTDTFQALPKGEPDVLYQVWTYQTSDEKPA